MSVCKSPRVRNKSESSNRAHESSKRTKHIHRAHTQSTHTQSTRTETTCSNGFRFGEQDGWRDFRMLIFLIATFLQLNDINLARRWAPRRAGKGRVKELVGQSETIAKSTRNRRGSKLGVREEKLLTIEQLIRSLLDLLFYWRFRFGFIKIVRYS